MTKGYSEPQSQAGDQTQNARQPALDTNLLWRVVDGLRVAFQTSCDCQAKGPDWRDHAENCASSYYGKLREELRQSLTQVSQTPASAVADDVEARQASEEKEPHLANTAVLQNALKECPWPADVWPTTIQEAGSTMRDFRISESIITAISGTLMRHGWKCAEKKVQEILSEHCGNSLAVGASSESPPSLSEPKEGPYDKVIRCAHAIANELDRAAGVSETEGVRGGETMSHFDFSETSSDAETDRHIHGDSLRRAAVADDVEAALREALRKADEGLGMIDGVLARHLFPEGACRAHIESLREANQQLLSEHGVSSPVGGVSSKEITPANFDQRLADLPPPSVEHVLQMERE